MATVVVPCSYCQVKISETVIKKLKTFLPSGFNHNICSFTPDATSVEGFKAVISLPSSTKEDMKLWKSEFEKKTLTTYRVEKKFKDGRKKVLYKEVFCCQHNTQRRGKCIYSSKKTGCKSKLIIGVLQVPEKYRGDNPHLPYLPGSASITWVHDHPIIAAATLRYRDVSETVTQRLLELFHSGCGPGEALEILQVEAENSPSFITQMGDRHFIPDYAHVWYLHKKSFEECYRRYTGPLCYADIISHVGQLESDMTFRSFYNESFLVIALTTPLMLRVHELVPQSGELVFFDASGGVDRYGTQVMNLMTHSPVGGLPLGCIITTSLSMEAIDKGLRLFLEMLPSSAFGGRGSRGPQVFMTDHSEPEINALKAVFPEAVTLLCTFHLLQAFWRWLFNRKNKVEKSDRPHILNLFKGLLYAADVATLEMKKEESLQDDIVHKYSNVISYFEKYWELREQWAVAYRTDLVIRGAHTNNIVEVSFRTLKDRILKRTKATNPVQLVDFVSTVQSGHYKRKIVGIISQPVVVEGSASSRNAQMKSKSIAGDSVEHLEGETFLIKTKSSKSNDVSYIVDTTIGVCTCPIGSNGTACKHQFAVLAHCGKGYAPNLLIASQEQRLQFLQVATGSRDDASTSMRECGVSERIVELEAQLAEFRSFCERAENMIRSDPETLLEPLTKYLKRGEDCMKTKTMFASALSTFGSACSTRRRGVKINVQPASIGRRKYGGGSSTRQTPGPQPKGSSRNKRTVDTEGPSLLPPRKRTKLAHSLSSVVAQNTQI